MADQSFDTTIVNPLERPSAADLNQLQAQIYRTSRTQDRLQFGWDYSTAYSGFLNLSFFVQNLTGTGMVLNMSRGIGYFETVSSSSSDIGGVPGLDDLSSYKPVFLSADKAITVPSLLTAGKCRRDLIEVRWKRELTNNVSTDIYNPGTQLFSPVTLAKTMSCDLVGETVDVLEPGEAVDPNAYIVYRKGVEIAYVNDDSWLSAPIPATDSGFLAVAVVNVKTGDTAIPSSRVADARKLLSQGAQFTISGTATIGTSGGVQGAALSDVSLNVPPGMACAITKIAEYESVAEHEYLLTIIGPQVKGLAPSFCIASPLPSANYPYMPQVVFRNYNQNFATNDYLQTVISDASYTTPATPVAIGQNISFFRFNLVVAKYLSGVVGQPLTIQSFNDFSLNDPTDLTRQISFVISGKYL